ncbi:MAG: hypothetical protein ABJC89_00095 [Acidobacteriota bacterium]
MSRLRAVPAGRSVYDAQPRGLGLAIVQEFTERQGGTVQALGRGTGQGSTFVVRFPCQS